MMSGHGHQPEDITPDTAPAKDTVRDTAMTVAGRAQLDAIVQECLAPLLDRIATLEREAGGREAESRAKDVTIDTQRGTLATQAERVAEQQAAIAELRRRAEAAEVERDRLNAAQTAPAPPHATAGSEAEVSAPAASAGILARVRRCFGGA